MISCECDEYDVMMVGEPVLVVCRTGGRKCDACEKTIDVGEHMYRRGCYDYSQYRPVPPIFWCEECGEMAMNLEEQGYCYDPGRGIRDQWLEYRKDTDGWEPTNKEGRKE